MTFRSRPLLELARGQECQVRTLHCNRNPETTVTAHNPFGERGIGLKTDDCDSCWACSACHDVLDGRAHLNLYTPIDRAEFFARGKANTQREMWERGLVQVAGFSERVAKPKASPKTLDRDAGKNRPWPPRAA